ncbi:MAG TPA: ABC transporter permease [Rhodanobacteraceae bacterium]
MFTYYLDLARRSLRRHWIMSALMVLAIGLGIGASMTMLTVVRVMSGDPLPARSAHLYRPFLNPLPLHFPVKPGQDGPAHAFTWPDAKALLDAHKGTRQAAMAQSYLVARSDVAGIHPKSVTGTFTTRDFFAMFGVPFVAGHAWSTQADANAAPVAVVTRKLAQRLFGTTAAVGKIAHLGKHDFEVVGVVADWHPEPSFYALNPDFDMHDAFFLPLSTAMSAHFHVNQVNGWDVKNMGSLTSPSVSWLNFWVQLDTPAQVTAYRRFLVNYSAQQKSLGRYQRPASDAKLYGLMQWLDHEGLVPGNVMLQTWLALGFLFVCMLNIIALLLAKFLRRRGEISMRRALGAKRRDIFRQLGVEAAAIGLAGGVLGIGIAELGLWSIRQQPNDYAHLAQMDSGMLAATVVLAILVSLLAGLLPAWRACCIAPAMQLKV